MKKAVLLFFLALLCSHAAATADFYIVSIALSPETIEEGSGTINVTVTVRNQGTAPVCWLQLSEAQKSYFTTQSIAANGGELTSTFSAINISPWESGTYAFVAKACADALCTVVQSQATKTLTILPKKKQLVPELSELLLPLIACAVLAIVFFVAGKRQG